MSFKTAKQVKDKIKNLAVKTKGNPQELLQIYMFERLVERISLSPYQQNFILKGGLLLSSIMGVDFRTTRDMDTTIKGLPVTEETMRKAIEEILAVPVDDNVTFSIEKVTPIREEAEYADFRFSLVACHDTMKIKLHIDITTGDVITPREVDFKYPFMFEEKKVNIMAYPIETVLAEKVETVLRRGIANTRARDFYDLYMLYKLKKDEINWGNLAEAIDKTSALRASQKYIKDYKSILQTLGKEPALLKEWDLYAQKHKYANGISFDETISVAWKVMDEVDRIKQIHRDKHIPLKEQIEMSEKKGIEKAAEQNKRSITPEFKEYR